MGVIRVEIYRKTGRFDTYAGKKSQLPIQVETEISTTVATTPGSRLEVAVAGGYRQLFARIKSDEVTYVAVGKDPTATILGGWALMPNIPLEDIPVSPGDLFSFIDAA